MRSPPLLLLLLLAAALAVVVVNVNASPATGALTELDEAQLCFHEYAPVWWNTLVEAARLGLRNRRPTGSGPHLARLAQLVQLLAAATRAGRDPVAIYDELTHSLIPLPAAALDELPWPRVMSKCLLAAHRTGTTASLFNADEEEAASISQA